MALGADLLVTGLKYIRSNHRTAKLSPPTHHNAMSVNKIDVFNCCVCNIVFLTDMILYS